jgi:hypothetical protein
MLVVFIASLGLAFFVVSGSHGCTRCTAMQLSWGTYLADMGWSSGNGLVPSSLMQDFQH